MSEEVVILHPSYWGTILLAAVTLLVTLLLGVLTFLTTKALRAGYRPIGNPLLSPADLLVRCVLIALLAGVAAMAGVPTPVLGWTVVGWFEQGIAGVLIGLVLASALALAGARLQGGVENAGFQPNEVVRLILPRSRREAVLVLLALAPAALLEELLFRSLWIGAGSLFLPLWLIVALSSLVFGLMHTAQGRVGVAATTLAGLLFGALFAWAGSLLLPFVAHYVANAAQVLYAARRARGIPPDMAAEAGDAETTEQQGKCD